MEFNYSSGGLGGPAATATGEDGKVEQQQDNTSSSGQYQIHNLETVAEESEVRKTAVTDLAQNPLVEGSTKSQLSKHLAQLLQAFIQRYRHDLEINSFDLLFMTIYCVGLETGFIPEGHRVSYAQPPQFASYDVRVMQLFSAIVPPKSFYNRSSRSYRLNLILPGSDEQCSLIAIKSGDFLCLTLTVPQRTIPIPGQSVVLPVSRYVPLINFQKLALSFQHLSELSLKLKNSIFVPIRTRLYSEGADIPLHPSLSGLPDEVVVMLLKRYLDRSSALRLSASCARLRSLAKAYCGDWFVHKRRK